MIQGDHLQLRYHFWMLGEMIFEGLPWFLHVYEFNYGNDADSYHSGSSYLPFSLFYAIFSKIGGVAIGWNMAQALCLWITFIFSWLLIRRYCPEHFWESLLLASIVLAFPNRWENLLGGSPAGFAMAWVPAVFLGLDMAVRDQSRKGGWLAGIAILFSCFGDLHVYFFVTLAAPLWCLFAALQEKSLWDSTLKKRIPWGSVTLALIPAVLLTGLSVAYSFYRKASIISNSSQMSAGRSLKEVDVYSPSWRGLFSWDYDTGTVHHICFGYFLTLLLSLALIFFVSKIFSKNKKPYLPILLFSLSLLVILTIVVLSLGTKGPFAATFYLGARKLIPEYDMIRQTSKIFCLLPSVIGVALAIFISASFSFWKSRIRAAFIFLLLAVVAEYKVHVNATICILDKEQLAYEAVAKDAKVSGFRPHVLILPLWPGDTAWSSLYEYYTSLYRITMVNGYSPIVSKKYFDEVFIPLNSANQGFLSDAQADFLLSRGIQYLLLHEDAFPYKVSPFPVGFTLKRLMEHPRLKLLKQDEVVWAFKILKIPTEKNPGTFSSWNSFFPSRFFEAEHLEKNAGFLVQDKNCSEGHFLSMKESGNTFQTRPLYMGEAQNIRWLVRLKGQGKFKLSLLSNKKICQEMSGEIYSSFWEWKTLFVEGWNTHAPLILKIENLSGNTDVDLCLLTAGLWDKELTLNESKTIPAPLFFHGGFTDLQSNSVHFLKDKVQADWKELNSILYGPNLPLAKGVYRMLWDFKTPAISGQPVAKIQLKSGKAVLLSKRILSGQPFECEFQIENNLPFVCEFIFTNEADVELKSCTLTRISH